MKVTVTLRLEIDRDAWDEFSGYNLTTAEIRQDIKDHTAELIHQHYKGLGLLQES